MKKVLTLIAAAGLFTVSAAASQSSYGTGEVAASWLGVPVNVRTSALAEAGVASTGGLGALYSNPAGLANVEGQKLSLMHNIWLEDLSFENASYAIGLSKAGGVALGFTYFNMGEVDTYSLDNAGVPVPGEAIKPTAMALSAGWGKTFRGYLSAGLALKYVSEDLKAEGTEATSAFAADLGLGMKMSESVNIGLSALNIGSEMDGYALPMTFKGGAEWKMGLGELGDTLNLSAEASVLAADTSATTIGVGAEYGIAELMDLRVGYKSAQRGTLSGLTGLTAGLGFAVAGMQVDYAVSPQGDLGTGHQFSIGADF